MEELSFNEWITERETTDSNEVLMSISCSGRSIDGRPLIKFNSKREKTNSIIGSFGNLSTIN